MTVELRNRLIHVALASAVLIGSSSVESRVLRIAIDSRTPVSNGEFFGNVGPYELVRGTASGELDPNDRRNAVITDITLAPKNAAGKVEYRSQFTIYKPVDMNRASGVMISYVPNRGRIEIPYVTDDPGFLWRRGDILMHAAWQGDMPITGPSSTVLGVDVPIAKMPDGSPVVSPVLDRFIAVPLSGGVPQTTQSLTTSGRTTASVDTATTTLVSATKESPEGIKSNVVTIPRTDYAFADCRATPFPGTPDPTRLCIKGGFNPALLYEFSYLAKDPYVLGVGQAAFRDVISFMKYSSFDDAGTPNPIAGRVTTVTSYGRSQAGRYLKHHLNLGMNEDESGRKLWDGANPDTGGRFGGFNVRFAQPGDIAELYDPGADGPLWWEEYTDNVRGHATWGILTRCRQTNTCPLVMDTLTGPEAWYSNGSVGWTGTDKLADRPIPANVRVYFHTGTTHNGGGGGYNLGTASTNPAVFSNSNPNPNTYINRALYVAMIEWLTMGREPPPSALPRISDGTLVPANSLAMGWPNIPNAPKPDGVINPVVDYDRGPLFRYNDGSGVISNAPAPIKQAIAGLVSKVDADGNEIGGVRSLLRRLPLGTYTGWNPIGSGPLAGREGSLAGGYIPFARTRAARLASGDPRLSIEERYPNLKSYYLAATIEANKMINERLLLPEDATRQLGRLFSDMYASKLLPVIGLPVPITTP